ncbi:MAG: hypothetical protein MUE46_18485 [Xanthomonadales bacterium]|jgi:hypothetical protein|nr:hypothetical protein [Xanthomonadales bacterium]
MSNLFERASREKLRFASPRGDLTVEQLWELPLQGKGGFDLDSVARSVHADWSKAREQSFVSTTPNAAMARLELALDLVKHVIATKLAEAAAARLAQTRKEERERIAEILARKQNAKLEALDEETLRLRLAQLADPIG